MVNKKRQRGRKEGNREPKETFLRKNALAIAALIVSVSFGLWNSCETRRFKADDNNRWDALNQPHFDITDAKLSGLREVEESQAVSGKWATGYHPIFSQVRTPDGIPTDRYIILSDLVFWDSKSNQPVTGTKPMQTDEDLEGEAKRLGLTNHELRVHYVASFRLRNLGTLAATNVTARFKITTDQVEEKQSSAPSIEGNNESYFIVDFYRFLDRPLPPDVSFQVWLDYDFGGQRKTYKIKTLIYHPANNRWDLG